MHLGCGNGVPSGIWVTWEWKLWPALFWPRHSTAARGSCLPSVAEAWPPLLTLLSSPSSPHPYPGHSGATPGFPTPKGPLWPFLQPLCLQAPVFGSLHHWNFANCGPLPSFPPQPVCPFPPPIWSHCPRCLLAGHSRAHDLAQPYSLLVLSPKSHQGPLEPVSSLSLWSPEAFASLEAPL